VCRHQTRSQTRARVKRRLAPSRRNLPLRREKRTKRITLTSVVPERLQPDSWKKACLSPASVLEEEFRELHSKAPADLSSEGDDGERLKHLYEAIHRLSKPRSALCLSGGGIRSAAFGLGLVQGLARKGLLSSFDYLSTVSGGGYTGGWLSAWAKNSGSFNSVESALGQQPRDVVEPEPEPLRNLRAYSNYLTPRLGLLSADTWTLIATVLRNLLLNWLVLIPLIGALTLLPRLLFDISSLKPDSAAPLWFTAAILFLISVGYALADLPSLFNRKLSQRAFLAFCLAPEFLAAYTASIAWAWSSQVYWLTPRPDAATFLKYGAYAGGVVFVIVAVVAFLQRRQLTRALTIAVAAAVSMSIGGSGAWLLTHRIFRQPAGDSDSLELYVSVAPGLVLMLIALSAVLYVGLSSRVTNDEDREWWSRAGAWALIATVVPIGANFLFLYGAKLPAAIGARLVTFAGAGGVAGLITAILGFSRKTLWRPASDTDKTKGSISRSIILAVAAPLFVAVLFILVSAGVLSAEQALYSHVGVSDEFRSLTVDGIILIALVGVGVLMSGFVHVNKFSLHAMYRNRLVRAFLGASRTNRDPDAPPSHELNLDSSQPRDPNPFTGFDPADNIPMKDLLGKRPLHIVNITLNLVQGRRLAWQERKAESFTVSRLHSGGRCVGYRRSSEYAGGITLGTAMTISGAAASPNMGYHSSPALTLLMTLFNARLGWWLGNPGEPGATTWFRKGPRFALKALLGEALGLTNDQNPYVYLSDGGHFENLGLYEMVLRRCHLIVVSDAGQDKDSRLDDLGNAVRKVRIDLGVPIVFRDRTDGGDTILPKGKYCAIADIKYSEVDRADASTSTPKLDGLLIYIKPRLIGSEPADVRNYQRIHPDFPHQPTTDQWFDEPQFESYRALGFHIAAQICSSAESVDGLAAQVERYLSRPAAGESIRE
jgi:hypothetical protein